MLFCLIRAKYYAELPITHFMVQCKTICKREDVRWDGLALKIPRFVGGGFSG